MLLRFRGRDGQFNITVQPDAEFPTLLPQLLGKLPPKTDPSSITLSNQPHGGDARTIVALKGVTLKQVGLGLVCALLV